MKHEYMHPADQLVTMMNRVYYQGLTTTSGGNLSIKDTDGNIWITPTGVDKGRLTREDIVKVLPGGETVGRQRPSVELPFHRMIMEVTGARAVLHAHPPGLVSVSLLRKAPNTATLPAFSGLIRKLGNSDYDIPGSVALGEKICKAFQEGCDAVMMENHGIVVCADTIFEAFQKFQAMENAARLTLEVTTLGKPKNLTKRQIKAYEGVRCAFGEADMRMVTPLEADVRNEISAFCRRCEKADLFASYDGALAARIEGDKFLVTPDDVDRAYLEPGNVVKIAGDKRQKGQRPSRFSAIFQQIFLRRPEVGGVAVASPVHAMAFGAARAELDSRTIPESYLMMRKPYRMGIDEFTANPLSVAEHISLSCPVVLVDNAAVFTAGANLTKAFDSLEVTEFTAQTILNARRMKSLGGIVAIGDQEVEDINVAFHLE